VHVVHVVHVVHAQCIESKTFLDGTPSPEKRLGSIISLADTKLMHDTHLPRSQGSHGKCPNHLIENDNHSRDENIKWLARYAIAPPEMF